MKHIYAGLVVFSMLFTVGCGNELENSELTTQQELTHTFAPGSYVIPMDTTHQDDGTLKAYGLVYRLLSNGVPIHWAIDEAKAQNGVDFTATTIDIQTFTTQTHGYRGGPFIIDSSDAAEALPIIVSWHTDGHVTNVHEATAAFDANVSRTLVAGPNIAVFQDGSEVIAFRYLNAAGIPDSQGQAWPNATSSSYPAWPDVLTDTELAGVSGVDDTILLNGDGAPTYCQLTSMHYDSTNVNDEVVREVRRWLEATPSTHAFLDCDSIRSFENNVNGQFLTTQGLLDASVNPNPLVSLAPGSPLVQFDGGFTSVSGSIRAFELSAGSSLHAVSQALIVSQAAPTTMVYLTGHVDGDLTNGKVTYLGGHEYSTGLPVSTNPSTNGVRHFLNSLFETPCAQAEGQPNLTFSISGPAETAIAEVTYTIQVNNTGPGFARDARVVAPLPAGAVFVGASAGGVLGADGVSWDLGSLLAGEGETLTFTVALAPGLSSQEAGVEWKVGLTEYGIDSSVDTEFLASGLPFAITGPGPNASINDSTPEISGIVGEGATVAVEIRDSQGTLVFSGDALVANGVWTIESDVLADGEYTVTATATDNGTTASTTTGLTVDTVPPSVSLDTPNSGTIYADPEVEVSGTSEEGAEVLVQVFDIQGLEVYSGTANSSGGTWSLTTDPLPDGQYTVTATATDAAGNTTTTQGSDIVVSLPGPTLMIRSPQDGESFPSGTLEVSGFTTADDVDLVVRYENGDIVAELTLARNSDGDFLGEVADLDDGEYTFEFTAESMGATSTVTHTIRVDTVAPVTTVTSPSEGSVTNDSTPTISGTGEPGSTVEVSINGEVIGQVLVDNDGTWTLTVTEPLEDGEYTITVESTDPAGNQGESVTQSVVVNTEIPAVSITSPQQDERVFDGVVTVTGTAEAGQAVDVFLDGELVGTVVSDASGVWSLEVMVAEGVHVLEAVATDEAGNTGSSGTVTFRFRLPAEVLVTSPTNGTTVEGPTLTIEGQGEPGSQVTIEVDGEIIIVPVDSNGNWSVTLTVFPGDLTVRVTDQFGRTVEIDIQVDDGIAPGPIPEQVDPILRSLVGGGGCTQAPVDAPPVGLFLCVLGWLGFLRRARTRD